MKEYCIVALVSILAVSSCYKSSTPRDVDPDPPAPSPPITITVLEKFTNKPIAGAQVNIQRCSKYDVVFGCVDHATIRTFTTNNEGKVTFTLPANFAALLVQHSNYYNSFTESVSDITLIPRGVIKVHIKKVNSYAPGDGLNIMVGADDCFSPFCWRRDYYFGQPTDTITHLEGLGYTNNLVSWYINFLSSGALHNLPAVFINGFDTAHVTLEY